MKYIQKYNIARNEIESRFTGLPHAHTRLLGLLITRADPETGLVENLSCRDLANLLAVDHAPGRKGAGIPKIEAIRSYLRTIAKSFPEDFRLINQGQRIACQFIHLPAVYAHFCAPKEVYGVNGKVSETANSIEKTEEFSEEELFWGRDDPVEPSAEAKPDAPVENIFINKNINNNNNNKNKKNTRNGRIPMAPITDDFRPTPETIAKGFASGYSFAADFDVIQDFIDKNRAWGSAYANYQPVYLQFLARRAERQKLNQQKQEQQEQTKTRRTSHATGSKSSQKRQPNAVERVKQAYANNYDFCEETGQFHRKDPHARRTHCYTVDAAC